MPRPSETGQGTGSSHLPVSRPSWVPRSPQMTEAGGSYHQHSTSELPEDSSELAQLHLQRIPGWCGPGRRTIFLGAPSVGYHLVVTGVSHGWDGSAQGIHVCFYSSAIKQCPHLIKQSLGFFKHVLASKSFLLTGLQRNT